MVYHPIEIFIFRQINNSISVQQAEAMVSESIGWVQSHKSKISGI